MSSGSSLRSTSSSSDSVWRKKENKKFEEALTYYGVDAPNLWEKVARAMGGTKSAEEVRRHYQFLVDDVKNIENGRIPFPKYKTQGFWTSKKFDDEGLPKWFAEDEKRHTQPMKPITKEEVEAMKAQFREIDARPSKKVAEAKARKKLEKARQKADIVADQSDINEQSKAKMIDKIYRKAVSTQKPKKEYVVAKKGVQVRTGKGKVLVDPRMKKDKRSAGSGKKGGKGGKGKGGSKGAKGKKDAGGGGQKKGGKAGGGRKAGGDKAPR